MMFTFESETLSGMKNAQNAFSYLNEIYTPNEAREKLISMGYDEDQFRSILCCDDSAHQLKVLCYVALGSQSAEVLKASNASYLHERIDLVSKTGNDEDGWNFAHIMYLMKDLY